MKLSKLYSIFFSLQCFLLLGCASTKKQESSSFKFDHNLSLEKSIADKNTEDINLFLTDNMHGGIGLCGCSMSPEGGIDRRYNFYKNNMSNNVFNNIVLVDAGNAFYPKLKDRKSKKGLVRKEKESITAIAEVHSRFNYKAHNIGKSDLAQGLLYNSKLAKLPFVSSNIEARNSYKVKFKPFIDLEKTANRTSIRILGLSGYKGSEYKTISAKDALNKYLLAPGASNINIVLSDIDRKENTSLITMFPKHFMLFVGTEGKSSLGTALDLASSIYISGPNFKQQVAHLRINKKPNEKHWTYLNRMIRMRRWLEKPKNKYSDLAARHNQSEH